MAFLLILGYCAMAQASFLQPTSFPRTKADLSFIDRLALNHAGYEQFESEYDSNGNCISGCSYAMPKWEDELEAMARWNAISRKNLKENHGYTENPDGSVNPPADTTPSVGTPPQVEPPAPILTDPGDIPYEPPFVPGPGCQDKNPSFRNSDIPYGNPLGYKACITSYYGPRNLFGRKYHYGIDFNAASGTPVYAPANGVVETVFVRNKTCGNGLVIRHSDGYSTKYCHFESVAVAKNDKISAGCLIGKSDNTGQSTGPHLHYSVLYQGQAVNPIDFIEPGHKSCY